MWEGSRWRNDGGTRVAIQGWPVTTRCRPVAPLVSHYEMRGRRRQPGAQGKTSNPVPRCIAERSGEVADEG